MIEILFLILTLTAQLLLGFVVLARNKNSDVNKSVAALAVAMAFWSLATYFSLHPVLIDQIFWVRTVLSMATLLCLFVLVTFLIFPNRRFSDYPLIKKLIIPYAIFVFFWVQTPFVFSGLEENSNGSAAPIVAPGIIFFTGLVIGYIGIAIVSLIKRYKSSDKTTKNQIRPVLFGVGLTFVLLLITNFILVSFFKNTSLLIFGPDITLIFLGSIAYAILKHHLFDIRSVIARLLAYVGSLAMIVLIFLFLSIGVSNIFLEQYGEDATSQVWFAFLSVLSALFFQPIKRIFDRATNRIFYQDAYDAQYVLNEINRALIGGNEVVGITGSVANIVTSNLKTDFTIFAIRETEQTPRHVNGTKEVDFSEHDVQIAVNATKNLDARVFTLDTVSEENPRLATVMRKYDIEVLIRMVVQGKGIGYMLVGPKKSGNAFGTQDLNLLDIVAGEVAIAVQNALRYEEIEQFNITLQKRVEDATAKLQKSNEKLKALDEAKDEFISMASHQLRTPLTSVKGYISMMLEGDAGELNENQRTFLDQAFVSSQRMVYLIADLLNVSRLKTGKFIIEAHPTYLPDTVESELAQLKETAKSRGLKLIFNKPKSFPTLNLDETKTRQVIMNFADNAIYYTPKGGTITVDLEATKDSITFSVKDNGIGVKKEDQHHLFTKFYRAGNARKARPDGTGLGLFMAKKVVVAQGGAVIFKSEEGKGSTFGFTFPRHKLEVTK